MKRVYIVHLLHSKGLEKETVFSDVKGVLFSIKGIRKEKSLKQNVIQNKG